MKIVFIASLYEKEARQFHYLSIVDLLESLGHQVIHQHITQPQATIEQLTSSQPSNIKFHQKILKLIKSSDLVVAEVTKQSVGVGFTIAEALKADKPVLALSSGEIPPITNFLEKHDLLLVHHYPNIRQLEDELAFLLTQIEPRKDKKFNMFLSLELDQYLLEAATNKKLSKSEYLRRLIEKDQQQTAALAKG